jgi:hypothetical protein
MPIETSHCGLSVHRGQSSTHMGRYGAVNINRIRHTHVVGHPFHATGKAFCAFGSPFSDVPVGAFRESTSCRWGFPGVERLSRAAQNQVFDFAFVCIRTHQSAGSSQVLFCWPLTQLSSRTTSHRRSRSAMAAHPKRYEVADGIQKVKV